MFLCIIFFPYDEKPHLHDFMVKFVIFQVNQVSFDQEQYTVALIQHKQRSKKTIGDETIPALQILLRTASACGVNALIC